jgi:putative transposase
MGKYKVAVHAYVLITNHVHVLMTPETEKGVSQLMQALGRYYVMYINKT